MTRHIMVRRAAPERWLIACVLAASLGPARAHAQSGESQQEAAATAASEPASAQEQAEGDAEQASTEPVQTREFGAVATATRTSHADASSAVHVITRRDIDHQSGLVTDSILRTDPSAATFRRSTSLVADPSSQGLNLRGVAPSGVSRSLVLLDGVPMNDPFGGWVYWRALPRLGIQRVEIVPGGGSALYGSSALGGVVQLFSRAPVAPSIDADLSYGSLHTLLLGARVAHGTARVGASLEGEWLRSDGYRIVAPEQRGAIDGDTPSEHGSLNAKLRVLATRRLQLSAALGGFRENQNGGTRYTTAQASLGSLSLQAQLDAQRAGSFALTLYGRLTEFEQQRARISPDRGMESRSARQRVPASDQGGSLSWQSRELSAGGTHVLAVGLDVRHVQGTSRERLFPPMPEPGSAVGRTAGGEQLLGGLFVQDLYAVHPRVELTGALRVDAYRTYAGERRVSFLEETARETSFAARHEQAINPRLGVAVRALDGLTLRAAGYRAFRAPSLNELYRPFQVGTIMTAANDQLGPESLLGAELGFEAASDDILFVRATAFYNHLDDAISNATLSAPLPDGATRQRKNLSEARVRGLELQLEWRLARHIRSTMAYTLVDSRVTDAGPSAELVGKRLAQDPVHRGTALLYFDDPNLFGLGITLRAVGRQFEDDLNTLPMAGYAVADLMVSRQLFWKLSAFASAENLFNSRYLVGRAGVDTLGAPFMARVGLRIREDGP